MNAPRCADCGREIRPWASLRATGDTCSPGDWEYCPPSTARKTVPSDAERLAGHLADGEPVTATAYLHDPTDGTAPYWVVQVDTEAGDEPAIRVYVNDGQVWAGVVRD